MIGLDPIYIEQIVTSALSEDIGSGDVTTLLTIPAGADARSEMLAKSAGVIAGLDVADAVFACLDPSAVFEAISSDGETVSPGTVIARICGSARAILTAERTALNLIQRMSGIATTTARYVQLVSHTNARILDTRKTTPGLRRLEKYSVRMGGGFNHRFGLSDGILIKDNHIVACGSIEAAVKAARTEASHTLKVEVEVTDLAGLDEAIRAGADVALLDNMSLDQMREAVKTAGGRILLEASGGVNEQTVTGIAETGVDMISVGALTHSPKAMDISLDFVS